MAYKFYRVTTIPCPDCDCCRQHDTPEIPVGKRFYVKNDDGTETAMTKEEWDAWAES